MTGAELWRLIREAATAWSDDDSPRIGASLSYYTLFSIAPLLLIVIAVAALVFDQAAVRGEIMQQLNSLVGTVGAKAIEDLLANAGDTTDQGLAAIVGTITLLIGATTVFAELQSALDRIWKVPADRRPAGVWGWMRARIFSFGMVLGIGFLLMVSLALSAVLTASGRTWSAWFGEWQLALQALNFVVSFAVVTVLFAMIYKILPRVRIGWRDVWIGAGVTALLFNAGKTLIGLYLGTSGITSTFGAAGSLAVLLVWVYYSAQVFLFGAELTWAYTHRFGSLRDQPRQGAIEETHPR